MLIRQAKPFRYKKTRNISFISAVRTIPQSKWFTFKEEVANVDNERIVKNYDNIIDT